VRWRARESKTKVLLGKEGRERAAGLTVNVLRPLRGGAGAKKEYITKHHLCSQKTRVWVDAL